MEKKLGQDAIDALLAGAGVSAASADSSTPEAFNFSRSGQISMEKLRAVSAVNDQFARSLMQTLGAWLRSQCHVALVAGEQLGFHEFLERLTMPTYLCAIRLEPLGAMGLIEIDLAIALPMVDLLLGGVGKTQALRELTDIEEAILTSVLETVMRELNTAWRDSGLEFVFEGRLGESKLTQAMSPGERTLHVSFEVRLPEAQGTMSLCLPAMALNAILRGAVADSGRQRRRSQETQRRVRELVGSASVGAVLQFPVMRLRAQELATLAPGVLLRLPLKRHESAELRIGGVRLGLAHAVRTGEHRGAEMVTPEHDMMREEAGRLLERAL